MYWTPSPFNFDERNHGSDPTVDWEELTTFNADSHSDSMYDLALHMREHYQGNHMFIPWGEDFAWGNASMNWRATQALLRNFPTHYDDMTLVVSDPYKYLNAIHEQKLEWPVRYADMFPYADSLNRYWSGFYTSRANSKFQIRRGQQDLHASNQMYVLKALNQSVATDDLKQIRHAKNQIMGVMGDYQHHDAVTGTAK